MMSGPWGLAGAGGFVGSTLRRQFEFSGQFGRTNLELASHETWSGFVCAAAPGQKWRANQQPEEDRAAIQSIIARLEPIRCKTFVLISTADVFASPQDCDEDTPTYVDELSPYGRHRLELEHFVERHFKRFLIVRLAGLVGPGLKKNALFDLAHGHQTERLDGRDVFQFYPVVNLMADVRRGLGAGLKRLHLAASPLRLAEVAQSCFATELGEQSRLPVRYDFLSRHAAIMGGQGAYAYSARESLLAIRAYAQSYQAMLDAKAARQAHAP